MYHLANKNKGNACSKETVDSQRINTNLSFISFFFFSLFLFFLCYFNLIYFKIIREMERKTDGICKKNARHWKVSVRPWKIGQIWEFLKGMLLILWRAQTWWAKYSLHPRVHSVLLLHLLLFRFVHFSRFFLFFILFLSVNAWIMKMFFTTHTWTNFFFEY